MSLAIKKPIFLLIAVNILIGFFIFRDYGLTWDEPYFYSYADALGYAYTPSNWVSGHFDLNNSYGISGDDHKTRGPAYLLLARTIVYGIESIGSDSASAWHLVNSLFFQLGIYLLYRLSRRFLTSQAALATAILFSTQPLLWGHAFINPKDPPFLTFFLASVCFGFEMADAITQNANNKWKKTFLAAFCLGIATSIRIIAPFAGVLIIIYFLLTIRRSYTTIHGPGSSVIGSASTVSQLPSILVYIILSILIMFITWPYLWESPATNFFNVLLFMSDNPTNLAVLFNGQLHRAGDLPLRYLPFMLLTTLTEPVWFLFFIGLVGAFWKRQKLHPLDEQDRKKYFIALTLMLSWLVALVLYVLARRPAMYDGFRHFLFILPPVFVFIGFAFEFLFERVDRLGNEKKAFQILTQTPKWLRATLAILLTLPGIVGIIRLHPYEYTYYNTFIGGTDGTFRNFETDYWLTCYKDAVEQLNTITSEPVKLYVKREAYIAETYADSHITVLDLRRGAADQVQSGDYVLVNTRTNEDRSTFRDAPTIIEVGRNGATFCIIRQIP